MKNAGIAAVAKTFINRLIDEYGSVVNLQIDSPHKNVLLEVLLKGDEKSIIIKIESYEVVTNNEISCIKFENIITSREWMNILVQNVIIPKIMPQKTYKINPVFAKIITLLI